MNHGGDLLRPKALEQGLTPVVRMHRRGHHVQKAHGRRAQFAADGSHLSGGMIALMPSEADAKRLALPGGEKAADLHCTLLFLGNDDGAAWPPDTRDAMEAAARLVASGLTPVQAKIFGTAHWNGGGDNPSWVWNVGDSPDQELADSTLHEVHNAVADILGMTLEAVHGDMPEIPRQHSPWAAHICAAYTDDLTLVRTLEKRNGPVTFDRIRLSFGDDDRDIPLTARGVSLTASGLRRAPADHEEFCDFAEHNRQWEGAVQSASTRLGSVLAQWRTQIREQVVSGMDTPEELAALSLDPAPAADLLYEGMHSLAERAGQSLQREAEKQGVTVPEWSLPDDAVTAAVGGRRLLRSVAEATSSLMAGSLVQSAKRIALGLITRRADPQTLAAEVDRELQAGQDSLLRGPVGTAMSTAQTAGRQAVLEAAPPGEYYASEILDKNTCAPCKAVDGEQFGDLERAIKAYPVMGYKDCIGPRYGNSCRGMIVARWTPEPESLVAHGTPGRPSYRTYHPSGRNKDSGKTEHANGGMLGSNRFDVDTHRAAVNRYVSDSYAVNEWLRRGVVPSGLTQKEVEREASVLSDLINIQRPQKARTVWRGTKAALPPMNIGDEFHDRGFTSVSDSKWIAETVFSQKGGGLVSIKMPEGTPGVTVGSVGASDAEEETVLLPGTRFRVIGILPANPPRPTGYELEIVNG